LLNKDRDSLDLSAFSSAQGSNTFCLNRSSDAGSYIYTYSETECNTSHLDCVGSGRVEVGTIETVKRGEGRGSLSAVLADTFLYTGTWLATSGPAAGSYGPNVYVTLLADSTTLTLRGFYCFFDGQTGLRQDCFPEFYRFTTHAASCDESNATLSEGGGGGGTWTKDLLLAILLPTAITVVMLALAVVAWATLCRRRGSASDRRFRAAVAAVRARLRITAADGFIVSSDPATAWWREWAAVPRRRRVFLQLSGVEAAARLALWEDFDVNQLDSLWLCLQAVGPPCLRFSFLALKPRLDTYAPAPTPYRPPAGPPERRPALPSLPVFPVAQAARREPFAAPHRVPGLAAGRDVGAP
jgi:hypothetical protein